MTTYDWIVIGAGITGASLAYELSQQNFKVLLLEKDQPPDNATLYSYGGLAYWSGTDELTRALAAEGINLHRHLSSELDAETEFREVDLVLTIDRQDDPEKISQSYERFAIAPELLNVQDACNLEPLLNPNAISGVLKLPHGHIQAQKTTAAYIEAMLRNDGKVLYERVLDLVRQGDKITAVTTKINTYSGHNTVVCAGGLSRSLLQQIGVKVNNYFTHAQLIMTPPVDLELATVVMPAVQQRFGLEASPISPELEQIELENPAPRVILDPGAVQFLDGSLCMGQISAITDDPHVQFDLAIAERDAKDASLRANPLGLLLQGSQREIAEAQIREQVGNILPLLEEIPGICHHCLVAFNPQGIALVGNLANITGLYLFSGFTSTLLYAPVLARRFAQSQTGKIDQIIEKLQLTLNQQVSKLE